MLWYRPCSSTWPASWGRDTTSSAADSATSLSPREKGRTRGTRPYETRFPSSTTQTVCDRINAAQKCDSVYTEFTVSFCTSLMFTGWCLLFYHKGEKIVGGGWKNAATFEPSTLFWNLKFCCRTQEHDEIIQMADKHDGCSKPAVINKKDTVAASASITTLMPVNPQL